MANATFIGDGLWPLPDSKTELAKEAQKLGLLSANPLTRNAAIKTPRGQLLAHIYDSYHANRHFNQVSMVALGNSGVGKSSAINHLLGIDIAKVLT